MQDGGLELEGKTGGATRKGNQERETERKTGKGKRKGKQDEKEKEIESEDDGYMRHICLYVKLYAGPSGIVYLL